VYSLISFFKIGDSGSGVKRPYERVPSTLITYKKIKQGLRANFYSITNLFYFLEK